MECVEDPQIPHSLADQGAERRWQPSWIITLVVFLPRATPVLTSQRSYNRTKQRDLLWTKCSIKAFGGEAVHAKTTTAAKAGYASALSV